MLNIYCPICGENMDMEKGCLMCTYTEQTLPKRTSEWILNSLKGVKKIEPVEVIEKKDRGYLCPNCRSELIHSENERNYSCSLCNLELRIMSHFQFQDLNEIHNEDY